MARKSWTEEMDAELRRMWAERLSASAIALHISAAHRAVTRNAIIGRLHRLDLTRKPRPRQSLDGPSRVPPKRRPPPPKARRVISPLAQIMRDPELMALLAAPPTDAVGVHSVDDLEPHHCRYPIGEPGSAGFGFCGQRRAPGLSYCPTHAMRCHVPIQRATTKPWLRGEIGRAIRYDVSMHKSAEEMISG